VVNDYAVKTVVVVNPLSANGALGRRWDAIARTLTRAIGPFEDVMTQGPRDATRLTRAALAEGADVVVAIGGDGTIHEVANGFFDGDKPVRAEAALGVVPFGTGGDFRKTADIPNDIDAAAEILRKGARRAIDVGLLEYRKGDHAGEKASCIFINIASFGIGGLVDQIVNTSSKLLGGRATFFLATVRAAMRYKNTPVRLTLDGDEALELTIQNVAVANGRYFGGGMHVAPNAALDDGILDVVAIGDMSFFEMMTSGTRIYKGTHLELPKVVARRARRVEAAPIDPAADVLLDVDGEAPGALPATFSVLPRALNLVGPA
jgi:YegS/Rv2252/BmrU family lipid kinase